MSTYGLKKKGSAHDVILNQTTTSTLNTSACNVRLSTHINEKELLI